MKRSRIAVAFRSAITGRFIRKAAAKRWPSRSVKERRRP